MFASISMQARVVELVDTQDLKSCGHCARAGSSPAPGTNPDANRGFSFRSMYLVYAISSLNKNYIYVGLNSNLEKR